MIDLLDIRHVRLGARDLAAADRFAREVIGLERVRIEAGAHYYRSDDRNHTLVYFEGELSDRGMAVHEGAAEALEQRHVQGLASFTDLSGNRIDLVERPHHGGRRCFAPHATGITGFSHVGLCSTDAPRDEAFWCSVLGARVSDRIGDAALLRIDPVHHKVALFQTTRSGIEHVNHQVASIDDLMRAWYRLREMGVKIVFGPGRHPTSGAVFLYFEGADGMVFECSTGVRSIAPEHEAHYRPRQFPAVPSSSCMWGALPDIPEFKKTHA